MIISLTFDNGPDAEVTPVVLDLLAERGILATFFVLGRNLKDPALRAIAERTLHAGHRLGNHSYSHSSPLGLMDDDVAIGEIEATQHLLGELAGAEKMFRPIGRRGRIGPHMFSQKTWDFLKRERYTCVIWNCLAEEWIDAHAWVEPTLARCRTQEWSTVVIHDIATGAIDHLAEFLDRLIEEGATFSLDFPQDCLAMRVGEELPMASSVVMRSGQT